MSHSDESMPRRLEGFLARRHTDVERVEVTDYQPMGGGYSCLMASFTASFDGEERRLVSRSDPPAGQALADTDRDREWALLAALTEAGTVPTPPALFYDPDGSELGEKTMILDFVDGQSLLADLHGTGEDRRREQADGLCELLAAVHSVDLDVLPTSFERPSDWDAYFDMCIEGWREADAEHMESLPVFRYLATWLSQHRPPPAPLTLVHGEFQSSNVMVDPRGRFHAVDWEIAHIGDPREDLGWLKFIGSIQPPDVIAGAEDHFCRKYCELTGLDREIVNPLTIVYFTILPLGRHFALLTRRLRALARGETTSITVAFYVGFVAALHKFWLETARAIEAARASGQEVVT